MRFFFGTLTNLILIFSSFFYFSGLKPNLKSCLCKSWFGNDLSGVLTYQIMPPSRFYFLSKIGNLSNTPQCMRIHISNYPESIHPPSYDRPWMVL